MGIPMFFVFLSLFFVAIAMNNSSNVGAIADLNPPAISAFAVSDKHQVNGKLYCQVTNNGNKSAMVELRAIFYRNKEVVGYDDETIYELPAHSSQERDFYGPRSTVKYDESKIEIKSVSSSWCQRPPVKDYPISDLHISDGHLFGKIKNATNRSPILTLRATYTDKKGKVVGYDDETIYDLKPGQTQDFSCFLVSDSGFLNGCHVRVLFE